jgi:hypothetical protein
MFVPPFSVSYVCLADALINARATPKEHRDASFAQRIEMAHNWVQQGRLATPLLARVRVPPGESWYQKVKRAKTG